MSAASHIWMDGSMVPWADAKIHVDSDGVLKGENVFEGLRAYWSKEQEQLFVFRVDDHLRRLRQSASIMRMVIPYTDTELSEAVVSTLRANNLREHAHVRLVSYFGKGKSNSWLPSEIEVNTFIIAKPGARALSTLNGVQACVSSWRRISDTSFPPRVKSGANYHNARLGTMQAVIDGYDQPIFLNGRGRVAEGGGACIFIVRDGVLITPSPSSDILEGITRATIMEIGRLDLGIECIEREIDRTELYVADEAFFCGSLHEIQPIIGVDRHVVGTGKVGRLTAAIQEAYFNTVEGRGEAERSARWNRAVYV